MRTCDKCGREIPEGRLRVFPNATNCVDCSDVQAVGGFQVISGKTEYCELQVLDSSLALKMRRLQNRKNYNANVNLSTYVGVNNRDNKEKKE